MAAVDYFLKLEGIDGDSTDRDHARWIEITSWSWGISNSGSASTGGGAGAGKANVQDLSFTFNFQKASPQLFLSCASGKHIKSGLLIGRDNKGREEFLKIELADVLVSSYQTGASSENLPFDSLSLNFAKVRFNDVVWDIAGNREG